MRKMILTLTFLAAAMIAPGLTPAAHARGFGWFATGAGFRIGGLDLSFVLGQPFGYRAPGYYYRTGAAIAYPGYHCNDRCFIDHGVAYHDRACPAVRHLFEVNRYDPYDAYVRYAPRYNGYYDDGYYERRSGYDRYDSYGGYGGYDRNDHRYDGYPVDRGGERYGRAYDQNRSRAYDRDRRYPSREGYDRGNSRRHQDGDRDRDHNRHDGYDHH